MLKFIVLGLCIVLLVGCGLFNMLAAPIEPLLPEPTMPAPTLTPMPVPQKYILTRTSGMVIGLVKVPDETTDDEDIAVMLELHKTLDETGRNFFLARCIHQFDNYWQCNGWLKER